MINKEDVLKYLEYIRTQRLCCYHGNICDCKYGYDYETSLTEGSYTTMFEKGHSEVTGCPEMREVIALLQHIPDEAFIIALFNLQQHTEEAYEECKDKISEILAGMNKFKKDPYKK